MERFTLWMVQLKTLVEELKNREEGQTLVEYALIIALVSVACIAGLQAMTGALNGIFSQISAALTAA
jgi:pilus assembly protein Flp/PilA